MQRTKRLAAAETSADILSKMKVDMTAIRKAEDRPYWGEAVYLLARAVLANPALVLMEASIPIDTWF